MPFKKGHITTEETKQKISKSNTGHIVTAETRKKISKNSKGRIVSENTKEKLRKGKFTKCSNCKKLIYRSPSRLIRSKNQFCNKKCNIEWEKRINILI